MQVKLSTTSHGIAALFMCEFAAVAINMHTNELDSEFVVCSSVKAVYCQPGLLRRHRPHWKRPGQALILVTHADAGHITPEIAQGLGGSRCITICGVTLSGFRTD